MKEQPDEDLAYSRTKGFNPDPSQVEVFRKLIREHKQNEAVPVTQPNSQRASLPLPRVLTMVVVLIILGLFGVFVWPTRYRYDHMSIPLVGSVPVRIDRITGEAESLGVGGWHKLGEVPAKPSSSP